MKVNHSKKNTSQAKKYHIFFLKHCINTLDKGHKIYNLDIGIPKISCRELLKGGPKSCWRNSKLKGMDMVKSWPDPTQPL